MSRWIDDVCGYRLPWGYNVLALYLRDAAEAAGADWPTACDYYSAFAKYGVHQLVACWLLTFGVSSRKVAMRAADAIVEEMEEPDELIKWLQNDGLVTLEERGLDTADVEMIREAITGFSRQVRAGVRPTGAVTVTFRTTAACAASLAPGDRVLLHSVSDSEEGAYQVFTLRGERIGRYVISERTEQLRGLLTTPELLDSVIESFDKDDDVIRLRVRITPV